MVRFSVFNELSLPLRGVSEFDDFFQTLSELRERGLEQIRMDRPFNRYPEILPNTSLSQLLGQITNRDKKRRLLSFINNGIAVIESPLIKVDEEENEQLFGNEYFYNGDSTVGALACCDIWNTITVSFKSHDIWDNHYIEIQKQNISTDDIVTIPIKVRNASDVSHLDSHKSLFDELEIEKKLDITQNNLWDKQKEFFPNRILFSKEVKKQIKNLDKNIFKSAINILRDVEKSRKKITDYNYSSESESVCNDKKLKKMRVFTYKDIKIQFNNHIKSLPNANRIYFLEHNKKIYIGYIGKHLPTKNND